MPKRKPPVPTRNTGVKTELWVTRSGFRARVTLRDPKGRIVRSWPHPLDDGKHLG